MYCKYQFRFGFNDLEVSKIFKDPEISKAFELAFMENYWLILKRMREYKKFLSSKNILNEQGFLPFDLNDLEDENKAILIFEQDLKKDILYLAMSDVSSSKLNLKFNIIERLNVDFIRENILDEHFLNSLNNLVDVNDASLGVPYEVLDNLISEFLQK